MRVLIVTHGSYGDIIPFVWIGKVLKKNGHEVFFIANPYFKEYVSDQGLVFQAIGTIEDYNNATIPPNLSGNRLKDKGEKIKMLKRVMNYIFIKPANEICSIVSELRTSETLIINHFYSYGAKLASDKFEIPNLNINLSPYWLKTFKKTNSLTDWIDNKIVRLTNNFIDKKIINDTIGSLRLGMGFEPLKKSSIEWMFEGNNACLYPEWYMTFELNGNIKNKFIGFPDYENVHNEPGENIKKFMNDNGRPVLFTAGTAFKGAKKFFEDAAVVLDKIGKPGIFLTKFPEILPQKLSSSILHLEFVRMDTILPNCIGIVHHGGIGTCCDALKAGIPQIICYQTDEQKENASVLKKFGICKGIPFEKLNSRLLLGALKDILENNDVRKKCNELQLTIMSESSEAKLMDAIHELCKQFYPIV